MKKTFNKKTIYSLKIIVFLLSFSFTKSYSQDLKLAGVQYNNYPNSEIKNNSESHDISFQEFGGYINFPKKLKNNKTILVNGLGYGYVKASLDTQLLPFIENNKTLQTFNYQFTLLHQWNEKWNILINITPTLASDFEAKISTEDFIFQGAAVVSLKINTKFKIGSGIGYSARFGTPRLVPLMNLHYKNNKHQINALLPLSLKYSYTLLPNNKLELGLKYILNGAHFNTESTGANNINEINYSRANIGASADYYITKTMRLEAFCGLSAARTYGAIATDGTEYDFDSETAPFFSLGMVIITKKRP
ncbi:hypothetical protein FNB79_15115 [Formosa sediminum]|uniref:DUF6268 domain-containing protein n=1 Tax=Formosa sediminum TaxID=2594004 RepID=A0A516GUR6_9FLAO|nr:DUF6268 family outer membrane beta-barrel protein [Formosa sediminum]QDO95246.1 hypothetical protein FNB79_15115 [Formosa sediminum]